MCLDFSAQTSSQSQEASYVYCWPDGMMVGGDLK